MMGKKMSVGKKNSKEKNKTTQLKKKKSKEAKIYRPDSH